MTAKPILLDLFCGAGGATRGYQLAGFYVIGVDREPQRHYVGDEFILGDALEIGANLMAARGVDAVHASPPCQGYSALRHLHQSREYPLLIEPTRALLRTYSGPTIMENVVGAPLQDPVMLCGQMFGLGVIRHRLFEVNGADGLVAPHHPLPHPPGLYSPSGNGDANWRRREQHPHLRGPGYVGRARAAMGVDWMPRDSLTQAIPPAYTEWIGQQIIERI